MEPQQVQKYELQANHELRIESGAGEPVLVRVEDGSAELFGAELQLGKNIDVAGTKVAVYTWTGCTLTVTGRPTIIYEASETPMAAYLNVHEVLQQRRQASRAGGGVPRGPRVLLAGPTDSGKSTICRMLVNWAVRAGWGPTFVDLDIGQGNITIPGCLAATSVEIPVDVESGYRADAPLVFFYGHASPSENPRHYKHCVESLAAVLDRRCEASPAASAAGCIVNTMGWVEGLGYELLRHAIVALQVDVVLLVDQDRLQAQLAADLGCGRPGATPVQVLSATEVPLPQLTVPPSLVKVSKSGGVVERRTDERRRARDAALQRYFYGDRGDLQPEAKVARAEQLSIFRVGGGPKAPVAALPIGSQSVADPLRVQAVAPAAADLTQCVLAVSHAEQPDKILSSSVAGFVLVKEIDAARGFVSYTAPCPGPLPGRYLVLGSVRSTID